MAQGIAAALDEPDSRKDLSIGILTDAGGTFCAGMDLRGFLTGDNPWRAAGSPASSSVRRSSR